MSRVRLQLEQTHFLVNIYHLMRIPVLHVAMIQVLEFGQQNAIEMQSSNTNSYLKDDPYMLH